MQRTIGELRERVLRHATAPCTETAIPRVTLSVLPQPGSGVSTVFAPVMCMVLQGAKRVTVGDTVLHYDSARYFLASLDIPAMGQVVAASPETPFVAVGLTLDRSALADLIAGMDPELIDREHARAEQSSFAIGTVTADLVQAWTALLDLLDRPDDIETLGPMREREILYRLLRDRLGGMLCQFAQQDGRLARIRRAIGWIRDHHDETLRTATLAEIAGMSVASFHRHFTAATAMSPLQYQKTLRLHAARRLLASGMEANRTAYSVGYESASQFSREYRRFFGAPPLRDAGRLRGQTPSMGPKGPASAS